MRQNKFTKFFLLGLILLIGFNSCTEDDLYQEPKYVIGKDIQETLDRINANIKNIQELIVASQTEVKVIEISKQNEYTTLNFSSGTTANLYTGKLNKDIPSLGISAEGGMYYWTVWHKNVEQWLENGGKKVPVFSTATSHLAYSENSVPLIHPTFGVNDEGYWTINVGGGHKEILDSNKDGIKAIAAKDITLFSSFNLSDNDFISVELLSETILSFGRTDVRFYIEEAEDGLPRFLEYAETIEIPFHATNITNIEAVDIPLGWVVEIDEANSIIKLTAPTGEKDSELTEAIIKIKGKDKNDIEFVAECDAYTLDLSHPHGTFVVIEGNMSSENGSLTYYDQYMHHYEDVYEKANEREDHGNVLQDIFVANNKIYLLSQNGSQIGGGERFIVCNARTLKKEYSHPMSFVSNDGVPVWPQHLVVTNDKAYIQYSTADMELSSGIRIFDLKTNTLASKDIEGTYGAFTKEGALKGRMILSRGKIYAGLGNAVVIIDPATDKVSKTISFTSQVKGLVKGADNNIHIAVAGDFTGSPYFPTFISNPKIVGIDHNGKHIYEKVLNDDITFPAATWTPSISMCASYTKSHIYLVTSDQFSVSTASRFNYETKEMEKDIIKSPSNDNLYGYMGVHPKTEDLFVGASASYIRTDIYQFGTTDSNVPNLKETHKYKKASPAGIDFGYRFSKEFIEK